MPKHFAKYINYKPKYDFERCKYVRSLLKKGYRGVDIEKLTGVGSSQISDIKKRLLEWR